MFRKLHNYSDSWQVDETYDKKEMRLQLVIRTNNTFNTLENHAITNTDRKMLHLE